MGFAELSAQPTEPTEGSTGTDLAVADDGWVVVEHRLHKALGVADEDEGVLMQVLGCVEPQVGSVAHQCRGDKSPHRQHTAFVLTEPQSSGVHDRTVHGFLLQHWEHC